MLTAQTKVIWTWTAGVLTACGSTALGLGVALGFSIDTSSALALAALVAPCGIFASISAPAGRSPACTSMLLGAAALGAAALIFVPLSYIVAAFDMPLRDAGFVAFDRALGFDWIALHNVVSESGILADLSRFIYASTYIALGLGWLWLLATGRHARFAVAILALTIAGAAGMAIAAFWPAVGAHQFFDIDSALTAGLNGTGAGRFHIEDLFAVRGGALRHVALDRVEGILQFPSYHTVAAVFIGWIFWPCRRLRIGFILFAASVPVTALVIGGHYLTDVLAGAVLAAASIAAALCLADRSGKVNDVAVRPAPTRVWETSTAGLSHVAPTARLDHAGFHDRRSHRGRGLVLAPIRLHGRALYRARDSPGAGFERSLPCTLSGLDSGN
jgi:membrane-associated phospholipid phosphatase